MMSMDCPRKDEVVLEHVSVRTDGVSWDFPPDGFPVPFGVVV